MAMSGAFNTSSYTVSGKTYYMTFHWSATNNGNRTATIYWSVTREGSSGYVSCGPTYAYANGSNILANGARLNVYPGVTIGSGSFTVWYSEAGDASFTASVSAAIYSSSVNCYSGDVGCYLDNIGYLPPTYNSVSASSITASSVYLSGSVNTYGASITGGGWDISTDGGSTWTYHSGGPTGATISGLNEATQYWYRGYVVTTGGGVNSSWATFTTLDDNFCRIINSDGTVSGKLPIYIIKSDGTVTKLVKSNVHIIN